MGSTSSGTWKRAESSAAKIFGARRRPLSGSANRPDIDGDDAIHPRLWIEVKYRQRWAIWSLWASTRAAAAKCIRVFQGGHKVPVVVIKEKGKPGMLVVVHSDDLMEVVTEYLAARTDDELLEIEFRVRNRRGLNDAAAGSEGG